MFFIRSVFGATEAVVIAARMAIIKEPIIGSVKNNWQALFYQTIKQNEHYEF